VLAMPGLRSTPAASSNVTSANYSHNTGVGFPVLAFRIWRNCRARYGGWKGSDRIVQTGSGEVRVRVRHGRPPYPVLGDEKEGGSNGSHGDGELSTPVVSLLVLIEAVAGDECSEWEWRRFRCTTVASVGQIHA
jgi:hypothetical protein